MREAKCTRQKKLKQNKAKIALKQRKANSQKLEQKANKQKTNTAKKATHQKKKERKTKKHKPRVSRRRGGRGKRVLAATWSCGAGRGGVGKSRKNFKHFDCKFLYFKKVHTNPIIESINGDKCRSVPVIVLPCVCVCVFQCVCVFVGVSVRWLTAANCSTQNGSQRKAQ